MGKLSKKTKAAIIVSSVGAVLSATLIAGTIIAFNYDSLLDVFFTSSEYKANVSEKELCEQVVEEGAVLLKNEDKALPLSNDELKVSLFGQNSVDFVYGGSGSGSVDTSKAPNLRDALEENGFTVNETLWDFYSKGDGENYRKETPDEAGHGNFAVNEVPVSKYSNKVLESLKDSNVGIVVIGRSGGESADLPRDNLSTGYKYLQIDKNERDNIKLACDNFDKVILIVNANNPMELGFLEEAEYAKVKAALWVGGVGQEGIRAIPKILKGEKNPSGRLVDTYAYDSTSAPSFQNLGNYSIANSNVTNGNKYLIYGEGIYVGYKYYETRYEDKVLRGGDNYDYSKTVQFPFGYGLSYTNFEYSDFNVVDAGDNKFDVSVTVKNIGDVEGKEVVQIYGQKPYSFGGVEASSVDLVGFGKTKLLKKGESETVKVTVDKKDLTSYDYKDAKTYILNQGDYYLSTGKNAHDALNNILARKGKTVSDQMTAAGNENLSAVAFSLSAVDKTTYAKSSITGQVITNQFDDVDVNKYENYTYLSRSDWAGTFPKTFKSGSRNASDALLKDLEFFNVNSDSSDDALVNAFTFKTDSKDTEYKVIDLIGVDITDPKWDDLISQLSYSQMTKLIRVGGYATQQLDRIGLPKTQDKDGPSGISGTLVGGDSCMAWPAEVVMSSTWNTGMIQELGVKFGEDSITAGVAGVYGPGADIHRSPYSGRNFEYYSEDPILSYKMAGAELKGLRSKGVITYAKHFALNDQETNRYGAAIFANEQAIREIFFKGFEGAVVEGQTNAAMAAMNRMGTRWVGAHKGAMTNVLRNEWGFKGFVITDQASVPAMFYQDHISGLWAGTDMWLNTNSDYWSLKDYKDDKTMQYYIHKSAKNIAYAITNSWAVNEQYKISEDGTVQETTSQTFPWRPILFALDGIVWAASIGGALILWLGVKKEKKEIK